MAFVSDVSALLSCRVSVRADFFPPSVKMRVSGGESSNLNAELLVPARTRAGSEVFPALLYCVRQRGPGRGQGLRACRLQGEPSPEQTNAENQALHLY